MLMTRMMPSWSGIWVQWVDLRPFEKSLSIPRCFLMLVSHCGEYASECAYEWQSLKLRNIRRVFVSIGNKFGTFTSHSPPPYEDRSI